MAAPTLIVGIGGIGGNVITRLAERINREKVANVELVVMDTDVNDLRKIREKYPRIYTVQTSPKGTVGKALDSNHHARDKWFPLNDGLTGKPFTEGAGQVRAVSRLAFDYAVEQGHMEELEKAIAKLHGLSSDAMRQEMRVIITGSIAGGTGSGLVLPVAMYIRNFLITRYQDNSAIIRGFFLEPDVVFGRLLDESERNTQRANAYAAVREMDAFFRKEYSGESDEYSHVVFNAPQPGLGERVDYPNILPYHFVFLMDALNANGDSLTDLDGRYDLEAYKKHAADCIYAQALSAVSARSNSSEDNVIRQLAANNGRSRYCGAGSACLEYPKNDIQRYIALNWAEQTISGEWLEIDNEFKRREREDSNLKRSNFYVNEYESRRGSGSVFYKTVAAKSEVKDDKGDTVDVVEQYIEDVIRHAEEWASSSLRSNCLQLRRCLFSSDDKELLRPLNASADEVQRLCEDGDPEGTMQGWLGTFFDNARRYASVAQEEVPTQASDFAKSSFAISDFDENPLKSRTQSWQLESVFRVQTGSETGSFHPAAVRYNLYKLSAELADRAQTARADADNAKDAMLKAERADYYVETSDEREDVSAAVSKILGEDKGKKRKIALPLPKLKKGAVGADEVDRLVEIATALNKFKKNIDAYVNSTVVYEFLEGAKRYVDSLAASYEAFYDHIEKEIKSIRSDISRIEINPSYNAPKGTSHRYVCASKQCLTAMKEECYMRSTSGELPIELCGDIYRSLLRFSKARESAKGYDARNEVSSELFKRLFKDVVLDYWYSMVMDTNKGYPKIVDKSIVQAIADEALYTTDRMLLDDHEENAHVETYIRRTLEGAKKLATPFIEPPVGEHPRRIEICAFSEEAFESDIACANEVRQLMWNSYNGTEVPSGEFSKYEILFYSSMYGFCATNLPKYAPEHVGMESRPEGEYHRAYFATVNQLSPNLKDNKLITPHIDRNWHLVCALPDINPDNERAIQHNIVHAFLHGLVFQRFATEPVIDGDDVYYLKASASRARTSLWVSNGTPCDRFYEVFDALKFSPPAVELLLQSSRDTLEKEKGQSRVSLSDCKLVKSIRSQAFSDLNFAAQGEQIVSAVKGAQGNTEARRTPMNIEGGRVHSRAVTNLFGIGLPEDDVRRTSLFEIPLIYRISLPQSELRESEIDMMVESIFQAVKDHLANFCDANDLPSRLGQLFEEQYLLFEWNLIGYEQEIPSINTSIVVSIVREKVLGYMEADMALSTRADRISGLQSQLNEAWGEYRKNRWN